MDLRIPVRQLMTTEVITVKPNDTMLRVHEIFGAKDIHHLPVVDPKGVVVGMMSTSDYLSVANAFPLFRPDKREEANKKLFSTLLVEDVMTRQVATLSPDDELVAAGSLFKENLFHAVPIVDEEGLLLGILTTYDLLEFFFNQPALLTQ
ncbi:MAG: CBS domain-containing protein [Saprospiraceae bacterium]|nr:CBS domain-containing protein [Saprospiraceae bacterium]MCB0622778.1 CBS domain-containing protein [Saprospiraceae bacterium]MCB0682361.1 CBS domain-containing protein [Saprospiraceae bacterium]